MISTGCDKVPRVAFIRRGGLLFSILLLIAFLTTRCVPALSTAPTGSRESTVPFITSIDTMKESKDTARAQLTDAQIQATIARAAALNAEYIAVSTDWDFTLDYLRRWVTATRAAKKHVWFRVHPAQWENDYDVGGVMTPDAYLTSLSTFIASAPELFRAGDILDPCPEPENGKYWLATYGGGWDLTAQRTAATDDYNRFILDGTHVADTALARAGVSGVTTTIRSTNGRIAASPAVLYPQTTARLGRVTIDSFPVITSTEPATVAGALTAEIARVHAVHDLPVILGEFGYSTHAAVDDAMQQAVLHAMLLSIDDIPYLRGSNYWVITGDAGVGSRLFASPDGGAGRPAAQELANFYRVRAIRSEDVAR